MQMRCHLHQPCHRAHDGYNPDPRRHAYEHRHRPGDPPFRPVQHIGDRNARKPRDPPLSQRLGADGDGAADQRGAVPAHLHHRHRPAEGRRDGGGFPAFPRPRPADDDGDPAGVRQHLVLAGFGQGAGQHRRHADGAAVTGRGSGRLRRGIGGARADRRGGHHHRRLAVSRRRSGASLLGAGLLGVRLDLHGIARAHRRDLCAEVRPTRRDHQFPRDAARLPVGHLLLDRRAAGLHAGDEPRQPVLLPDRRGALRHDRRVRQLALGVALVSCLVVVGLAWTWLRKGYRLKP